MNPAKTIRFEDILWSDLVKDPFRNSLLALVVLKKKCCEGFLTKSTTAMIGFVMTSVGMDCERRGSRTELHLSLIHI